MNLYRRLCYFPFLIDLRFKNDGFLFLKMLIINKNEIKGDTLDYISLKTFVPLKNYKDENAFLISFSNTRPNVYGMYTVIGYSSFKNTKRSIITENVHATVVSEKDDSFDNYNNFYFKWDTEKQSLLVYQEGFDTFLFEERGNIILADLVPTI